MHQKLQLQLERIKPRYNVLFELRIWEGAKPEHARLEVSALEVGALAKHQVDGEQGATVVMHWVSLRARGRYSAGAAHP